ncbi:unnamed protein product [Didymodactylos carnosus]|uniref:Flavin-containing monooxygenase n=1 Tax=Didymodactylos carnosus TaxID=1234261 RepID=A0A814PT34_9BILA|nr:unnamed protein product [Didymodactylos carnosus]CAF1141152.1 unnamed protein product [Didymodactylos carnosus]CAF3874801.1 unnamed protein product [Didymodactylos carnosus]CAF3936826.1 unnamed protein product [Didymodactylos carnosus]
MDSRSFTQQVTETVHESTVSDVDTTNGSTATRHKNQVSLTDRSVVQKVAIIGGGVSGLIAIKCCLEEGLIPVCYEMTDDIGGLWNYDAKAGMEGKASVMKSTVINTSKEFMAFSDFPPPKEYPNYMHNAKLLQYFRMYAEHFKLTPFIRFNRRVRLVEPTDDYSKTGQWIIHNENATKSEFDAAADIVDAVILATGHHAFPRWAKFPGLDHFNGKKLHSWQYKTFHEFENKTVLIVGIGNSAGDMAVELSRVAKQIRLYKYVWPSHLTHPTLAVLGLIQPWGAINPMSELQARWATRVFKGLNSLPSKEVMEDDIDDKLDEMTKRYVSSPRHTVQVDHVPYCDELAAEIFCKPDIWKYLTTDVKLGLKLIFDGCTPYRYRLQGPNKWNGAREAIMTVNER